MRLHVHAARLLRALQLESSERRPALRCAHLCSLAVLATLAVAAVPAQAQGAPAMHWGAMDLPTGVNHCIGRTRKAYYDAGVTGDQATGWQVFGRKGNVSVLVSCAPRTAAASYLLVVATSPDSKAAELLRNDVRTRISRMREFDTNQ